MPAHHHPLPQYATLPTIRDSTNLSDTTYPASPADYPPPHPVDPGQLDGPSLTMTTFLHRQLLRLHGRLALLVWLGVAKRRHRLTLGVVRWLCFPGERS